jgi:hypothetical protein
MEDIQRLIERRGIRQLLHFTAVENIPSIAKHGLLSVERCELKGIASARNDDLRLDGRLDGISLSISRTNKALLHRFRERHPGRDYAVLTIDPGVIYARRAAFFRLNAAKGLYRQFHEADLSDANAFTDALTKDRAQRREMPDNEQSEIMVFGDVPLQYIKGIHFETSGALERSRRAMAGIPAKVSPRYFR